MGEVYYIMFRQHLELESGKDKEVLGFTYKLGIRFCEGRPVHETPLYNQFVNKASIYIYMYKGQLRNFKVMIFTL